VREKLAAIVHSSDDEHPFSAAGVGTAVGKKPPHPLLVLGKLCSGRVFSTSVVRRNKPSPKYTSLLCRLSHHHLVHPAADSKSGRFCSLKRSASWPPGSRPAPPRRWWGPTCDSSPGQEHGTACCSTSRRSSRRPSVSGSKRWGCSPSGLILEVGILPGTHPIDRFSRESLGSDCTAF